MIEDAAGSARWRGERPIDAWLAAWAAARAGIVPPGPGDDDDDDDDETPIGDPDEDEGYGDEDDDDDDEDTLWAAWPS
jgi:hypothetical protein